MDARVHQRGACHHGLVTYLSAGWIGEGAHQGVLGPVFVDWPGLLDGHRLPRNPAVVAGEPLQGCAAGDVHLHVGFGGFHALGQLVFPGQVQAADLVQIADQDDVLEVERRRIVAHAGGKPHPHQGIGGQVGQAFFPGRNDGIPDCPADGGILPGKPGAFGNG